MGAATPSNPAAFPSKIVIQTFCLYATPARPGGQRLLAPRNASDSTRLRTLPQQPGWPKPLDGAPRCFKSALQLQNMTVDRGSRKNTGERPTGKPEALNACGCWRTLEALFGVTTSTGLMSAGCAKPPVRMLSVLVCLLQGGA